MTLTRSGSEIADYFAEAMGAGLAAEGANAGSGVTAADEVRAIDGGPLRPRYNLCPSQDVLTITAPPEGSGLGGCYAWRRWGLVPAWAKDPAIGARMFNARSETAAEKPSFRSAWKQRRCLVVADGFYEWTPRARDHQPFHFHASSGGLLAMAGLYEHWHGQGGEVIDSCTVLTTDANNDLDGVHHRMPVILLVEDYSSWLAVDTGPQQLAALAVAPPPGSLTSVPVTRFVNDPRHEGPECLAPVEPVEQNGLFSLEGGEA
jgi:putative SOS response-associated peptidase YedK